MEKITSVTDFFIQFRGKEFKDNGKLICKAAAWELYRLNRWQAKGHMVTHKDKPGWNKGELKNGLRYSMYLMSIEFR